MNFQRISFAVALTLMLPMISFAESGDSDKPVQIFSDKFDGDDVKQVAIYTGNVAVHQGTLEIHGAKLVLSIDPQGFRHAVLTPEKGKLVRFKQRRDQQTPGVEEWMHGEGDKLTYNEKSNQLILTNNAEVFRTENGVLKDRSRGVRIVYNMTNSTADITGDKSRGSAGRVSTVIAPRDSSASPARSKGVELERNTRVTQ